MKFSQTLKTLVLVLSFGAAAIATTAAPVTFWFSGKIDYVNNPTNALPVGITEGTPFSGRWTYVPGNHNYYSGATNVTGTSSNFYYHALADYSVLVQIGDHTITNAAILPTGWSGTVHTYDNFFNQDQLAYYAGQTGLMVDGHPVTNGYVNLELYDPTKTALTSGANPTNAPTIQAYPSTRRFTWYSADGSDETLFVIQGQIEVLSTNELVTLNLRDVSSNTAQLAWPVGIAGMTLQSTTNLASGNWQDVATPVTDLGMEHTLAVSTTGAPKFYRLKK